jgi:cytidylate kinase
VLVTASPETRARRIGEEAGIDAAKAERAVKKADGDRRDYLRRFYKLPEETPTQYDLVVNTDLVSLEEAAAFVADAAARRSTLTT